VKIAREQFVIDVYASGGVERVLDESLWEAVSTKVHSGLKKNESDSAIFVHPGSATNASFRMGNVYVDKDSLHVSSHWYAQRPVWL